jgi:cephalosporin hydroxylase
LTPEELFEAEKQASMAAVREDDEIQTLTQQWFEASCRHRYSYNFTWMGRPIIQFPQDIVGMQEVIWAVRPDLIIETGIAHGGSLVFYASMLELLGGDRRIVGIDIDIRAHNRSAIESHPMAGRIDMIEGSSVDDGVVGQVRDRAEGRETVLVVLDSNHTHEHVLKELELYSPFVTKGSYLVVFDTIVERMPDEAFADRPWGRGNNAWTAVQAFLETNDRFVVDRQMDDKLLITVAPGGYLRCVAE